jgi:carbamoyl-phosphate synthase large subunit
MARSATEIMLGKKLADLELTHRTIPHYGVKEAVFPFYFYPEADPVLGPEMRSTGEVLGIAEDYGLAFFKAQDATKSALPTEGTVLLTVCERDRDATLLGAAKVFAAQGFDLVATSGTRQFLADGGVESQPILKVHEGRPNIDDAIRNGEIQLVINTPSGKLSATDDSYIRKAAVKHKVPYITTIAAAVAAAKGVAAARGSEIGVKALQDYHTDLV